MRRTGRPSIVYEVYTHLTNPLGGERNGSENGVGDLRSFNWKNMPAKYMLISLTHLEVTGMRVVGVVGMGRIAGVWNVYATCDHSRNTHAYEVHAYLFDPPKGLKRGAGWSNGGRDSV